MSFRRGEVPLKRLRSQQCGQRFRPADACLAEVRGHNITPALCDLAASVGSSWPAKPAAGVLKRLSGVVLSPERLRQMTNEQGQTLAQAQREQAEQMLKEAVSLPKNQRERRFPCLPPVPTNLVAGGTRWGMSSLAGATGRYGRPKKIGAVASHCEPVGKHGRHRLARQRYVAPFGPAEEMELLSYAAACELGATETRQ